MPRLGHTMPSVGEVRVAAVQQESVLCRVFNPQGQMVKQDFISRSGRYALNLSELHSGCYWLHVHTDAGTALLKVIR